ncbi:NAD(P)H-hydrate dehydratase [Streptomyces tateyamensis]|uniref:Bifunctional NAD(P)H-hydrate repair enzyme n=1 Tax=Streptomyces tateyamensis TaxID=565073 RepID=A0A2V4N281_9ACTN|nr:NAD(P)H-hydrate dehydratase [Streptomyces tateyamensis]PYC78060.1 NAD(P)H-hydrate dehydratase [Streptomyces tateyamensis]
MREAHTVAQVRAAEAALAGQPLMDRAVAGLAATCARLLARRRGRVYGARVLVLAGSGDNGGDALFAGAALARRGAAVTAVLLAPERAHPGALAALRATGSQLTADQDVGLADFRRADLILDGIVGIGGRGGLRPAAQPYARAGRRGLLVAVDLPSGVDADTGEVAGEALRADVTVTFGTHKPGLLIDPGAEYAGTVQLVPIGLRPPAAPVQALQHADVAALLPRPGAESDKYRRGVLGVLAGSERYPGAALLAVAGALHGGVGAVRYQGRPGEEVVRRHPEVLLTPGRVQAWVVGPGSGDEAPGALADALADEVPVLVDADGLTELARLGPGALAGRAAPTLLTPHTGEAARLLGGGVTAQQVAGARLHRARELAERYGAVVLLKGSTTVVARPDGAVRVNPTGTAWLATAGSGDVLAGFTGALLAAGLGAFDAASAGAYLHGVAGRIAAADAPVTAGEVAQALPAAWREVCGV